MMGAETANDAPTARKPQRWHALGVFLAAFSLLIQAFVVQPHIDGLAFVHADGVEAAASHIKAPLSGEKPGICIICQEAALAGAVTLAATPALLLIERNFIQTAPAHLQRVVCRAPSHNWQSRAPPLFV